MARKALDPELHEELTALAAEIGCRVLEVTFSGETLRVILDHPDGVTLKHCESVSRQLSALLDAHDFGRDRYVLEVSSPGLDRPLYGPDDYRRFQGKLARITYDGAQGEKASRQTVVGHLESFEEAADGGRVIVVESAEGSRHQIPLAAVVRARLEIEL